MDFLLIRDFRDAACTMGLLSVGDATVQSLERPWIPSINGPGGQQGISCIPPGLYTMEKHDSEAHPRTWALVNEDLGVIHWPSPKFPNARTTVLLHPANWPSELRGCIAPGLKRGTDSVLDSRLAYGQLVSGVPWIDGHSIQIKEAIA